MQLMEQDDGSDYGGGGYSYGGGSGNSIGVTQSAPAPTYGGTPGQQAAAQHLADLQGQTAADWIPTGPSGTENIGISAGAYSNQGLQDLMNAPDGTVSTQQWNDALAAANAAASQGSAALGAANYQDQINAANTNVQWWNDHPNGDADWMDNFMGTVFPMIVLGAVGAGAAGMYGAGAGGASAAGGAGAVGEVGLGSQAINASALQDLGFLDSIGGAGGVSSSAGAIAGGLGSSMPVVTIGAPAGGGGLGLGPALGAGLGAGAILGANPTQPINHDALQQMPDVTDPAGPGIPSVAVPGTRPDVIGTVSPGNMPTPPIPYLPPGSVQQGPGNSSNPSGIPGLSDILNGVLPLIGGNVDHIKAQQDADWWKSQLDTLQGMYKPGTPEADLMEQKMRAKDAAAGRNSQYGIRATDLAAQLADKRANIMTSAGYQNMANAYRNRSSQDLNGLFGALGNSGVQSLITSGINGISSIFGLGGGSAAPSLTPPTR